MTRAFTIAAISVPVVYTQEGDHDPNGMVFVPQKLVPLLKWCRALWYDTANLDADRGPTTLPRLHHRRQRAQLVIDLLERLDAMIARLMRGTEEDQALLARHIARETFGTRDDCHHYDSDPHRDHDEARRYHASDRDRAVRMNFERVLEELDIALTDLRRTRGLAEWNEPDVRTGVQSALADAEERFLPPPVRLVSLTPAQRHDLHEHWRVQERIIARAIADWLDQRKPTASDRQLRSLAQAAGLSDEWLARLIFNDHVSGTAGRCDRFNPVKPWPMLRPLVLRGCVGEQIDIELHNLLSRRPVDLFVQGQVMTSAVCPPGGRVNVTFDLGDDEGVWPLNDVADVRGDEAGTNTHGLFGAVIAEPAGTHWLDPETGDDLTACDWAAPLDVILQPADHTPEAGAQPYVDYETDRANGVRRCFREFTVFIHDEPEIHSGLHTVGDHSLMPLSYRAAPMHNRLPHRMRELVASSRAHPLPAPGTIDLRAFGWELGEELDEVFLTARDSDGRWLERIAGEEQHHSSWLFGDPPTHVQRAYAGDPCRVRLVHAGVKETHIYHLHVHEWHAVRTQTAKPSVHGEAAYDRANGAPVYAAGSGAETGKGSHLLDSVTISPQVGMTIDPLFGSGSRQKAIGDIIWHCHLYPHFHHGMWGLWRSYDRLVDGTRPYPDGSYCPPLMPLPDRPVPAPEHDKPGFPWFVDGTYPAKSPPPPAAIAEHRNGRRILLGMPDASPLERAAMADGCRDGKTPGALFVDLDRLATAWNTAAGLFRGGGRQRKISYDVEVRHDRIAYNVDGWYDPRGHHYRLMKATIREMDEAGEYQIVEEMDFPHDPGTHPEPIFPRANHGDIVEWRQFNTLPAFDADQYDFAQLAVECGLHVHLVKFDVLAADGSATGWNYLSGASSPGAVGAGAPGEQRNVSLHRWVVDEEFGPCFFHDHLLANFRQRRGLFAALMVQPHGSQWHRADDQSRRAWDAQQAVIVPPVESALPPYREACLAVADYVPMLNRHGKALNPPPVLSGMSDPGVMGVNYRCAPLRFRGQDPSTWFSSAVRADRNFAGDVGDPDTPIIRSYPGERLRIRLIQGSHEEQHSFTAHGLRWRRDWGHPGATLVNQQTLGISEAFTLDINPADASRYEAGDHLWHFGTMDDLWLGTWGLVRVLPPTPENRARFAPLPAPSLTPEEALKAMRDAAKPLRREDGDPVRTYVVAAQCHEHHYLGDILTDPWGLIYRAVPCDADAIAAAIEEELDVEASGVGAVPPDKGFNRLLAAAGGRMGTEEPLVLRALAGEWVRVILVNDLLRADDDDLERQRAGRPRFGPEPSPARLPTEHRDWRGHPDRRTVSPRVSLHPALLHYDVAFADGGYVGLNPDTTIAARRQRDDAHGMHGGNVEQPGPDLQAPDGGVLAHAGHGARRNWREYWWWADPKLAPRPGADGGMGQVCYLHDMADIRNHRHHGLVGALVVLPTDVRPYRSGSDSVEGWTDFTADIRAAESGALIARETFWFAQDGLRFFVNGDPLAPMADAEPDLDPVDGGQKAVNYRTYPVHRGRIGPGGPAPILDTQAGDKVWLRVLGANDKPRQYGVVIHGARWPQAPWMDGNAPMIGALSGIAPCRVEDVAFTLQGVGDHPVRPGNFLWPTQQGMWARIAAR